MEHQNDSQNKSASFLSKFRNLGLLFIVAMIVGGVVKVFVKDMAKGRHSSGNPPAQTAGAEWHRHSMGKLSLESPGALKPLQTEAPEETRRALRSNEGYGYSENDFAMTANHFVYAEGAKLDPQKAAEDTVSRASQSKDAAQFAHKTSSFMRDGRQGTLIAGNFKVEGIPHVHKAVVFIDKGDMWLVTLTFREADAEATSQRVLDSVKITP